MTKQLEDRKGEAAPGEGDCRFFRGFPSTGVIDRRIPSVFCTALGGYGVSEGQARTEWVGRNSKGPSEAFEGLADGCSIHGLSDGTWSLIDGIEELLDRCGPSDVTVSAWTAANADIERAERLLQDGRIRALRLLVDRSFESRQPRYCGRARHLFGDQALRVWNSHAKFVLVLGGKIDVLYTTSANLNQNKRLENFTLFAGGDLPRQG